MQKHLQSNIEALLVNYKTLQIDQTIDFTKFNQYLISHHSTNIEGSTLTYVETTVLLENGLTPKGKPLIHSLMQTDHHNALLFTLEKAKNALHYTPYLIQNINAKVMHHTGQIYCTVLGNVDATKGEYRKGNVFAGQTTFVNFNKISGLVLDACSKIQKQLTTSISNIGIIDKLIFSFMMHYDLVNIHPFYDGNGRTSRLLMNAIQAFYGLPLAIVFAEDKVDYIQALIDARKKEDVHIFIEFMMQQYIKHLSAIIQSIQSNN
jgi:Fic family protein